MNTSWFCIPRRSVPKILASVSEIENKQLELPTLRIQTLESRPPTPPKNKVSPETSDDTSTEGHSTTHQPPRSFLHRLFFRSQVQGSSE